jgi:uncharacterized protein YabN with tetrapyrrole methylase and pyrophosphatase domain
LAAFPPELDPDMRRTNSARSGSLTVVGTGIKPGLHTTTEARRSIETADEVLYLLADPVMSRWLEGLNHSARSLAPFYRLDHSRRGEIYVAIVAEVLSRVRMERDICLALYGHPGVFSTIGHEAVRRARLEGYAVTMIPGVSALDCLFADLGLDPGRAGCQCFDATDFLTHRRSIDTSVPLILWQVRVVGQVRASEVVNRGGMDVLVERLEQLYGEDHEVVLYEAVPYPVGNPIIKRLPVRHLSRAAVTAMSTLYVPPNSTAPPDPDVIQRLGLNVDA